MFVEPSAKTKLLSRPSQKIRVITVSQYRMVRSGLRHILALEPHVEIVGEAETLDQARNVLHQLRPAVVVIETVEVAVPEIEQFVAEAEQSNHTHVVLLASSNKPHVLRALLRAGLTAYVSKESNDTELLVAVRSAACGGRFVDPALVEAIALEESNRDIVPPSGRRLSFREKQVMRRLVRGHTSGEIAPELGISVKTVETYRSRIYKKLEIDSRAALMKYAAAVGMISLGAADAVTVTNDKNSLH